MIKKKDNTKTTKSNNLRHCPKVPPWALFRLGNYRSSIFVYDIYTIVDETTTKRNKPNHVSRCSHMADDVNSRRMN